MAARRAIGIAVHQRLVALNQALGVTHHMRFAHLVLHAHLISDRLEAIGIIGDKNLSVNTPGNRLNPRFEGLNILRRSAHQWSGPAH